MYNVSENNCAFLFMSELRQFSMNFNKFWQVLVGRWQNGWNCTLYIHFPLYLDLLQSDCSDLVSKWRGHSVTTTFFLRGHYQTCAGCWETISYVSTGRHLGVSARDTAAFLERDARNASLSRRVCPCMRGTFWARILTIFSLSVMPTNKSAK